MLVIIFLLRYFYAATFLVLFPFLHLLLLQMLGDLGIAKAWLLRFVDDDRLMNAT